MWLFFVQWPPCAQIIDCANSHKRKIVVSGQHGECGVQGHRDGLLKIPRGIMVELDQLKRYQDNQIVLITTGSQGEPMTLDPHG
jgi:ribonuclease J